MTKKNKAAKRTTKATAGKFGVALWRIEDVRPYEKNPRINDSAVDAVAASLQEFGFRQPIVVDAQGVIIVGHTRWKAAKKIGLAKVPVHVATDLSAAQIKAYRIADNQTATLAEWDLELLPIELADLQGDGFDMGLLGFGEGQLAQLLETDVAGGLTDPDAIPEPPDKAITKPGDLWIMGDHRLLCGDSRKPGDVDRLVDGARIDLVNMDPPYNVKLEPRSKNAIAAASSRCSNTHHQSFDLARDPGKGKATDKKLRPKDRTLVSDFVSDEVFDQMLLDWFGNASRVLKPGGSFYIWAGWTNLGNYAAPLKAAGLHWAQGIVWDKQHPVLTQNKDFLSAFEICFYGWKKGAGHKFYGPHNATNLWHVKKIAPASMIHLTEKPVELGVMAIQYSSKPGENVLDLLAGSGSILMGCEQTGRHAYLMEIDPLYCDVIVQRWEEFAGRKAERSRPRAKSRRRTPRPK